MHRFFVAPEAIANGTAVIEGEDVQHMKKVLRLSHGDEVTLCDGRKTEYTARIERMEKECITLQILASASSKTEPRCSVTLYQGLPKAGKLETIVQKCVELGVSRIIPFQAARSVVQLSARDFEKSARVMRALPMRPPSNPGAGSFRR